MSFRRNRISFQGLNVEVECLESRTVPSHSPVIAAAHVGDAGSANRGPGQSSSAESEVHLAATLVSNDPTVNAAGSVSFESKSKGGKTSSELNVQVSGLAARTTFDVTVDGVVVGKVTTNAAGAGRLELKFGDKSNPLPANFPTITANSVVAVGANLSGKFDAPLRLDEHGPEVRAETHLAARLSDPTGASKITGQSEFESETEHGMIISVFKVNVSNAAPNTTLNVKVDGVAIGSIVVDATGRGSLMLATTPLAGSSLPIPANFPALHAGSTITVGDVVTGTFAASR